MADGCELSDISYCSSNWPERPVIWCIWNISGIVANQPLLRQSSKPSSSSPSRRITQRLPHLTSTHPPATHGCPGRRLLGGRLHRHARMSISRPEFNIIELRTHPRTERRQRQRGVRESTTTTRNAWCRCAQVPSPQDLSSDGRREAVGDEPCGSHASNGGDGGAKGC